MDNMKKSIIAFSIISIVLLPNFVYCKIIFDTCGNGHSDFNVYSFTFDGVTYLANNRGGLIIHKPVKPVEPVKCKCECNIDKDNDKKGSFYHGSLFCVVPNCLVNHAYKNSDGTTYDFGDVFEDEDSK